MRSSGLCSKGLASWSQRSAAWSKQEAAGSFDVPSSSSRGTRALITPHSGVQESPPRLTRTNRGYLRLGELLTELRNSASKPA
jgi:hypothetical protein